MLYKLIDYLQQRNPTITGIPNKISALEKRKLEETNRFWHGRDYRLLHPKSVKQG